ncbi:MAG: lipid A deacylase LpxR family protein [Acetobacteraceae bacterium]|nr:lipid A deacylase LpxR family protein [Acetobacteraceae bacterium]
MPVRPSRLLIVSICLGPMAAAARAEPLDDPSHTITIQWENDSTRPGSDGYYTNGARIAYTSPTGQVPGVLASLGRALVGEGQQRFAVELSQNMFTPFFTKPVNPPRNDRPYAAVLMGTLSLIQDTDATRTALALGLGVIGPAALGREAQNGFHGLISQGPINGWGTQLSNQPVIQLTADRTWRVPLGGIGGLEVDVLPSMTAAAGTFRIYAQAGGTVRIGQGLRSDFGAPRIRPGLTGTDAYTPVQPFAWYVFAGANVQVVAWDETLDGLPFSNSRRVNASPFVGEFQAGITLMAWGARLTAMQVLQSNEFRGQRNGLFQFTSLSVSVKF